MVVSDECLSLNKALVFYYYRSKEQLFERVVERYYQAHREALAGAFGDTGDLRTRLHRMVDAYIDFIAANNAWARLVQGMIASKSGPQGLIERNLEQMMAWTSSALAEVGDLSGALAPRHFFVTFSGAVINYFTYAPVLAPIWGHDPLSEAGIAERRAHLHWLVEAIVDRLEMDTPTLGASTTAGRQN